ncbi:MAG: Ribosomal RNA small subunit methyltransferase H [Candidatus Azambacteria bacterium GW2011_GWB2_46_37]|uniref:Ribosomal RNA small subunit methyltransferase H n=7 Tax=Candidatus Azamiibacteriota TaxID=1752741 RepID=A0A0G1Q6F1_9BACT|nr:MAG: Ribosomal RNA small subunit methyltransferase H [Candidatus Azambacteria bacterium GW2011_GWA2_45_90]KKU22587.1 MAG: Ribosomal RNA small subunit methyltransferase H [Candidatus Azambacteria bacterium GW2011_GWC1_46_13]KKU36540.1 MAG: Ribosomal RNA small subunit methyltransferase H [Candidatus Azambacteria bacterium GW2011_GWB1_46_27]KKU37593.1 MAG: Ribosomal RNA small subunit methyltransferase H [Candidatus Azambacteria bacterium GW2011_GWF2_46_32]KKU39393.1 MAG: Ribosomal RNA small sub
MHIPVLPKEVLQYLDPKPNENFIDCTIGEAGHAIEILKKTSPGGKLLGIDLNEDSLKSSEFKIKESGLDGKRIVLANDNFANLKNIAERFNFRPVQGILFDLGISSEELEKSGRGFSFLKDEPLLMTLWKDIKPDDLTAEKIVNNFRTEELEKIFKEYGEERFAGRIAARIAEERKRKRIKTTGELVEIIRKALPAKYKYGKIHFATRTFQALRIATNDELANLEKALVQALNVLSLRGRLAVISFHSLEDRIVKNFLKERQRNNSVKILTKKPVRPGEEEIAGNHRSRSAKLRAAEKIT